MVSRRKYAILSVFILTLCLTIFTKTAIAADRPVHTSITVNPVNQSGTDVLTVSLSADYNTQGYSNPTIHYQWGTDAEKTALNSVTFDVINGHNILTFWSTVYDKNGKAIDEKKQKRDFYVNTISPGLTLILPVQDFLTNQDSIIVSGTAQNQTTVQINNEPAFTGSGEFSQTVLLVPGPNTITVTETDNSTKTPISTIITRSGFYDNLPPVITLTGNDPSVVPLGSAFSDPGANASDNHDQNVIVTSNGNVDTNTVGSYTLTYSATDTSGNIVTKTRTVQVVDSEAPVITLNGDDLLLVQLGSVFSNPGAIATDNYDQNVQVTVSGTVDTNTVGSYELTYSATDASGNIVTKTRTVQVVDSETPVITINGDDPLIVQLGSVFNDPGASATDNYDSNVPITVSGTVDINMIGSYELTYSAMDTSGNVATKMRTVNVVDSVAPVITLIGDDPLLVQLGSIFGDPGAIANDNYDQNVQVKVSGTVDTNTVGSYTLTYSATDDSGNEALSVTRMVNVVNPIPVGPKLTITSPVDGLVVDQTQLIVSGNVEAADSIVKINGTRVSTDVNGNFTKTLILVLGVNTISITASDTQGNLTTESRTVSAPYVTVTAPADQLVTNQASVTVSGKVAAGAALTVNDVPVTADTNGNYSYVYTLVDGANTITVKAGSTTVTRSVTKDTLGPMLSISSPTENENLSGTQVTVTGTVDIGASIKVNNLPVIPDASGNFSKALNLNLGANTITVIATDAAGNPTKKDIVVNAPYVTVTAPADQLVTNQASVTVSGKVAVGEALTVNDVPVTADTNGNYSYSYTLVDGTNTITVKAGTTTVTRSVTKDTLGPTLSIISPTENENLSGTQVTVTGTVDIGASIKVNNLPVTPDASGNFSKTLNLNLGANTITVIATDAAGNPTQKDILVSAPYVTVTAPADQLVTNQASVTVSGKVAVGAALTINDAPVTADTNGNYSYVYTLVDGANTITVKAGSTTITRSVTKDTLGPTLSISSPAENENLSGTQVTVTGTVEAGSSVKVNNITVTPDASGNFTKTLNVNLGANTITVIATDVAGNPTKKDISVSSPYVTVTAPAPADQLVTNQASVTVSGKVAVGAVLTINDVPVTPDTNGNYSYVYTLVDGVNTITVKAGSTIVTRSVTQDTLGPTLNISSPAENENLSGTEVTVTGTVEAGASVRINNLPVTPDASGNFTKTLNVNLGANTITVIATDAAGNPTQKDIPVIAPYVTFTAPADQLVTNQASVTVSGKVAAGATITINDVPVTADTNGNYSYSYTLIDGTNTITVKAGSTTVTRSVTQDTLGPTLNIISPAENESLSGTQVTVTGTVEGGASIKVNNLPVTPDASGNFSKTLNLNLGANTITVIATDVAGNPTQKDIPVITPYITVTAPADQLITNQANVTVSGKVAVGAALTINDAPVTPDTNGNYSYVYTLVDGTNTITVKAGPTTITRSVTQDSLGPTLSIISPVENENLSGTQVTVTGTVEAGASVRINNLPVIPDGSGNFSKTLNLNLGTSTITMIATDAAGNPTQKDISVTAPYVSVTAPANQLITNQANVTVSGKVAAGVAFTINDVPVTADINDNYSHSYTLVDGVNTITVKAGSTTITRSVTQDTLGPTLNISSPAENESLSGTQVTVTGTVEAGASIKMNNLPVTPDASGNFSKTLNLNLGASTITVIATDAAGNPTQKDIPVIAPYVTVTAPADQLVTKQASVTVSGKVAVGAALTINDVLVTPDTNGNYSYVYTLVDGANTITVKAGSTTITRSVTQDSQGPTLSITSPAENENLSGTQVTVTGTVEAGASIKVNNLPVTPDASGNFSKTLNLNLGANIITVIATDAAGNPTQKDIPVSAPYVTVTAPADQIVTNQASVTVSGKVAVGAVLTINDVLVAPDTNGNYSYVYTLVDEVNTITVKAGSTIITRSVTQDTILPLLEVSSPADGSIVSQGQVTITGQAEIGSIVKVNGLNATLDANGNFNKTIFLVPGSNTISITATDASGNSTLVIITVTQTV